MSRFLDRLAVDRHLALVTVDDPVHALVWVDRVRSAGFGTLEIALRTAAGLDAITRAASNPDVLVGAGTVVNPAQVDAALAAGAGFIVTPGWQVDVVARCRELGLPVLPGVATPGEAMEAMLAGLSAVKFFPAAALGGPAAVAAWAGPFPGLRLVPSGGVTREQAAEYLALPSVLAVSGSWVLNR